MKNVPIKKGDRYTNHLGQFCIVKSVYKGIVKLQVIDPDEPYTEVWDIDDFLERKTIFKLPMPKIDRTNVAKYLLEYQFNMIGKTLYESKRTPGWIDTWTITEQQFKFFEMYSIPLLKKIFKINTGRAKGIFEWFNLQFGLKIKG